ncbi:MAG: DUF3152 domain-containing protein [Actinomycetes bacterium]
MLALRPRPSAVVACLASAALTAACGGAEVTSTPQGEGSPAPVAAERTAPPGQAAPSGAPRSEATPSEETPATTASPEPPTPDELAGVLARDVPARGSGGTVVVPGAQPAPGAGEEHRVRVEVEGGLPVDGGAFATFVLDTLNDPRGWTADGATFSRTDGDADVVVVLASPETSAALCRPLRTNGTLSCRKGDRAVLTHFRWVNGADEFDDLTVYRQYLVNHEVGHYLGHDHVGCPRSGAPAPVMQQQTLMVAPCVPNAWPYP